MTSWCSQVFCLILVNCLLINGIHPEYATVVYHVKYILFYFFYDMSIPKLTGLWLIHLELVLISLPVSLGSFFMVMFAGILSTVMLSGWSSHATCLPLASSHCIMRVILSLFPLLLIVVFPWLTCVLSSAVCNLGILLCLTRTVSENVL